MKGSETTPISNGESTTTANVSHDATTEIDTTTIKPDVETTTASASELNLDSAVRVPLAPLPSSR